MKRLNGVILLILVGVVPLTHAQVSNFTLVNAVNNKQVSLSNFSSKKAVVVIFTSNYCPYSKLYEDRLKDLHTEFTTRGVQFVLINPNDPESSRNDSVEEMKARAEKNGYPFPYLADKDQKVSSEFGAMKTPQAYVLVPSAGKFRIVYNGAIDDNPQVDTDVSRHYLREALEAVLSGIKPATAKTNPTGCIIKRG